MIQRRIKSVFLFLRMELSSFRKEALLSKSLQILFVSSELEDFAKTGGLADVIKALPLMLQKQGHDVRIVVPYYPSIAENSQNHPTDRKLLGTNGRTCPRLFCL